MNEVHVVAKRGENEFHRYRYATMGDILKEVTPLLGRHGIVIFQSETGRAMFDDDNVIAVEYAFTVAHASGETWPHVIKQTGVSTCRNSKGGWDDKSLNKCHTAARKYFLLALFQIPTGEEDDADQADRRPAPAVVPAVVHRVRSVAPEYVVPPPSRALKQGIAERAMVARAHREWQRPAGPSKAFLASEAGRSNDPPPHDFIPDGPGEAARALNRRLHPMHDELPGDLGPPKQPAKVDGDTGIPDFLDRRRKATTEPPSYLDLVEGGDR
jgi:ERF superfamily